MILKMLRRKRRQMLIDQTRTARAQARLERRMALRFLRFALAKD
jgi:hypothetical protein